MPRVRCVTMQKEEGLLLDAWLRYYGYLFGFENLVVLDNGSRDRLTCDILEQFEAAGVVVHRQHTTIEAFEGKGGLIAEIIQGWDNTHDYDFALPCDTDEFLTLFTTDGLSCSRVRIAAALARLVGVDQALSLRTSLFNVPSQPGWFHPQLFQKGFLRSGSILSLDSGFHVPQSRLSEGARSTDFTYLHYHNKAYEVLQAHTRRKLYRRVDLNDLSALRAYTGAGLHMTKNLLMSRDEYLHQYDNALILRFRAFPILMRALGASDRMIVGEASATAERGAGHASAGVVLRLPSGEGGPAETVGFDGRGYLEDHPDVAAASDCGLPHYLYYGFEEGRSLRRADSLPHALTG